MNHNFLITIVAAVSLLTSCHQKSADNLEEMARRSSRKEAVPVKTIELQPSVFYHELVSNGRTYSVNKAVVPFRVNGLIKELYIKNGQTVASGDLLAVIDDFEYRIQLSRAGEELEKAKINFKNDLLSYFITDDTSKLSPSQIKNAKIRSGLTNAQILHKEALHNYSCTRITAPISGVVADLKALTLNPSQNYSSLCTIINDREMEVEFPVIESEFGFISKGMPVSIVPFSGSSSTIPGTVTQINPRVDETGMVSIRAAFRNNGTIIDGMNVRVHIRKPEAGRLVVPKEALVIRQGKDVIFVRQDSLAIWKYVTVEFENSTSVSISEGLEAGDLVIIRGNVNLAHETVVSEQ